MRFHWHIPVLARPSSLLGFHRATLLRENTHSTAGTEGCPESSFSLSNFFKNNLFYFIFGLESQRGVFSKLKLNTGGSAPLSDDRRGAEK